MSAGCGDEQASQISTADCTLLLVRHAHTEMAGTFLRTNRSATQRRGTGAARRNWSRGLAAYPVTHIFSSDLQRARQTAESIAERCASAGSVMLHSLREFAFGSWEGLNWDQVMAQDPQYAQRWLDHYPSVPAPGGETF